MAELGGEQQLTSGPRGGLHHPHRGRPADRERLLAQHVQTVLEGRDGERRVLGGRRADGDGVETGHTEQLGARRDGVQAFRPGGGHDRRRRIGHGDDLHPRHGAPGLEVHASRASESDDADSHVLDPLDGLRRAPRAPAPSGPKASWPS